LKDIKKGWKSVSNKKKKYILFFVLIILICITVLPGIIIKNSVDKPSIDTKKVTKSELTLQNDYMSAMNANATDNMPDFTSEMVNKIKRLPEVKKINVESRMHVNSEYQLDMTEKQKQMEEMSSNTGIPDGYKVPTQYVYGIDDFNQIDIFKKGKASLVEGVAPYESKEKNPVVISKKIAELNQLKIGDKYKINGGYSSSSPIDCSIVGIFDYSDQQVNNNESDFSVAMDSETNKIYTTIKSVEEIATLDNPSQDKMVYEYINIQLKEPNQIDTIISKIKKEFNYNWDYTKFIYD